MQADTIVPEPGNPQALNRYSYCLNDPVNYADPSGYRYTESAGPPAYQYSDLTAWIVDAMNYYAGIPEIADILPLLNTANTGGAKGAAYAVWIDLVFNQHPLDFKRVTLKQLGKSVKLDIYWFEYSTPGNILFGFLGEAAGFYPVEIHAGATAAQAWDHVTGQGKLGPFEPSYFDEPDDCEAIRLGRLVYREAYASDSQVSMTEFTALLTDYAPLTRYAERTDPYSKQEPYPYRVRYFEGPTAPFFSFLLPSFP